MNNSIEDQISEIITREGGYVNHSADRGGPTNFGITQETLASWRGQPVTEWQVKTMTEAEARAIYRERYFGAYPGVTDVKVLRFLVDYGVNSGTGRAVEALQTVIGAFPDGAWGPKSKAALAAVPDQSKLYWPLVCERLDNYLRIIGHDRSQVVFAIGWANRIVPFWKGVNDA